MSFARANLRALAEAARGEDFYSGARFMFGEAADPFTVIALLERLDKAERLLREAHHWLAQSDPDAAAMTTAEIVSAFLKENQ